jgi:hypothetical protein
MADKKLLSVEESLTAFEKTVGEARRALDVAAEAVSPMRGRTVDTYVASTAIDRAARNLRSALRAADDQLFNLLFNLLIDIKPGLE